MRPRHAGEFGLRAPAQGACAYANISEHCSSFRTSRMTSPDRTARAEQACAELAAAGQPVTFTAVAALGARPGRPGP
jgi:hypothetical protein